jgi:hypothetical protein
MPAITMSGAAGPLGLRSVMPFAPTSAVGDSRVAEEPLRLVNAVAGDEGGALLLGEDHVDLGGDPALHVHRRIVEQRGRRRRHGVELHGREGEFGELRIARLRPRGGFRHPARRHAARRERLLQHRAGDLAHGRKRADRRDGGKPAADLRVGLRRHEIAAVRRRADRHGLALQRPERALVAAAHIGGEGRLVLARLEAALAAAEGGACLLQRKLVDDALVLVHRAVDALHLVARHHVGGQLLLDLAEPPVVRLLEGLEGLHEIVEGGGHRFRHGLDFRRGLVALHAVFLFFGWHFQPKRNRFGVG